MFYQFYFLASSLLAHCNLKNLVLQAFEFFFFFFFPLPVNSPFILAYVTMHTIGIFRSLAEGGGLQAAKKIITCAFRKRVFEHKKKLFNTH